MMKQKILAFMQNQWFKKPDEVKAMYVRHLNQRNYFIKRFLFAGCVSGKRLLAAFGNDLCNEIIWEEASPEIAGHSSGVFPADIEHIEAAIILHKPNLILCFGKIAGDAVRKIGVDVPVHYLPHPSARGETVEKMRSMAAEIKAGNKKACW